MPHPWPAERAAQGRASRLEGIRRGRGHAATRNGGYGKVCGATLARAHARSGDRIAIAAYLGSGTQFDRAIVRFSEAYAEQNERDYAALVGAVRSGRLTAQTGL